MGLGNSILAVAILGFVLLGAVTMQSWLTEMSLTPEAVGLAWAKPSSAAEVAGVSVLPNELVPDASGVSIAPEDQLAVESAGDASVQAQARPTPGTTWRPPRELAALPPNNTITHLRLPRIGLDSQVVVSKFDRKAATWDIPAHNVGHAEFTAGAGELGNAVLLGHVTSLNLGHVFLNLNKAKPGDLLEVSTYGDKYQYRVLDVSTVPRTDVSVLDPTPTATMTLITCTGKWLPLERDYEDRLIVRAVLEAGSA